MSKPTSKPDEPERLDFAALGLEEVEREARKQLRVDLQRIFDDLTPQQLAQPKAYLQLFPAFGSYARSMVSARAEDLLLKASDAQEFEAKVEQFYRSLLDQIAPSPDAPIPDSQTIPFDTNAYDVGRWIGYSLTRGGFLRSLLSIRDARGTENKEQWDWDTESVDSWEEHRFNPLDYLNRDCLWEEYIFSCCSDPMIGEKLRGAQFHYSLVYAMRTGRQDLEQHLGSRLADLEEQLRAGFDARLANQAEPLSECGEHPQAVENGIQKGQASSFPQLKSFTELEVRFISDELVQASWPGGSATWNFIELGFEDGRSKGKANKLWERLKTLAVSGNTLNWSRASERAKLEKDMQRLRKHLRSLFGTDDDPLPLNTAERGYAAAFKLTAVDLDRF